MVSPTVLRILPMHQPRPAARAAELHPPGRHDVPTDPIARGIRGELRFHVQQRMGLTGHVSTLPVYRTYGNAHASGQRSIVQSVTTYRRPAGSITFP